jgi:hypothetical protein
MTVGTRAKHVLRRAAEWERSKLGISSVMPTAVKRRLGRAIRKRMLPEGRRFLRDDGAVEFFQAVHARGTRYVVIRWFETLPDQHDGDIDFLVGDDGLPDFEELLDRQPSGIPCDVYAESGRPGFSYGGIPYYPPELARRILDRRITVAGTVAAPCPEDHFLSLAYHCVYRKGPDSGLPTRHRSVRPVATPKHDYHGTLTALADKLGLPVAIDMESLDQYLGEQGWRPPAEILQQLAVDNHWIHFHFGADGGAGPQAAAPAALGARSKTSAPDRPGPVPVPQEPGDRS